MVHGDQVHLKRVIKGMWRNGFEVCHVVTAGGSALAAVAHARVVAQAAFLQVWVRQGIRTGDALVLKQQHITSSKEH